MISYAHILLLAGTLVKYSNFRLTWLRKYCSHVFSVVVVSCFISYGYSVVCMRLCKLGDKHYLGIWWKHLALTFQSRYDCKSKSHCSGLFSLWNLRCKVDIVQPCPIQITYLFLYYKHLGIILKHGILLFLYVPLSISISFNVNSEYFCCTKSFVFESFVLLGNPSCLSPICFCDGNWKVCFSDCVFCFFSTMSV